MTGTAALVRRAAAAGLAASLVVGTAVGLAASLLPDAGAAAAGVITASAATVRAADYDPDAEDAPFPELEVTVSQTRDLVSQGIVISWTGGKPSDRPVPGQNGGSNFLQFAQCWGTDLSDPAHPVPDRTTCQYGGSNSPGTTRNSVMADDPVAPEDQQYTVPGSGTLRQTYTSIPFRPAEEGRAIVSDLEVNADGVLVRKTGVDVNTNQYFTAYTTNEVRWAGSGAGGDGSAPFEVQTAMQSPGLGCGTPIPSGGQIVGQSCWLVVIPRGTGDSGAPLITRSGLLWDAWKHHLAVRLDFAPIGVRCEIGGAERQLAGSELVAAAISSWQPRLCQGEEGAAFVLSTGNEADAVSRAARGGRSPLAFTSRPLQTGDVEPEDPLVYAPVALSGLTVSFAIDRAVHPQLPDIPDDARARDHLPFERMNLTPRLVAKLLTGSYVDALPSGADRSHIGFVDFGTPGPNARTMLQDPDFLDVNDAEWKYQNIIATSVADALVPSGRSDLAVQLWRYVMADAEARAFLEGQPDPWGMKVNPYYSTNPEVNPTGTGLAMPLDTFPKADPIEKADTTGSGDVGGTGPVNLVTWRPYTLDFTNGAYDVLRGDGLLLGTWDLNSVPRKYGKGDRELLGRQRVIALSTAPAAATYQTVTASLENPAGQFVAPTPESMLAAAAAMTPTPARPDVYEFDPAGSAAAAAPSAYPLAMPVYAAASPALDEAERKVYANLIRYAAGPGQQPGTGIGQLPPGYAPMPPGWADAAFAAADRIEAGVLPPPARPSAAPVSRPATPARAAPAAPAPLPPPPAPPAGGAPAPLGTASGPLTGRPTPDDPSVGAIAAAVPAGLFSGLAAAAGVGLSARLRRRT